MISISLCMIVKNEEKVLARCLKSVCDVFDEIIIIDTGSTDSTKEIANKFTNKVFDFMWQDDFSLARNYSFSKATKDYIMWLDADDVLDEENKQKLLNLKQTATKIVDVYMLKYNIAFDENNNPTFTYFRERILKREKNFIWNDPIHEVIIPSGKIEYADIAINHKSEKKIYTNRNLKIYEKIIKQGKKLSARQQFYYARELMYNNKIKKAITNFKKFLNLSDGWIENKINACLDLHNCYAKLNDFEGAIESLLLSFVFDKPRAEICCQLGYLFQSQNQYDIAIYWFNSALNCKADINAGGFIQTDYYNFIPHLELCVCYYRQGNYVLAKVHNELAGTFKPKSKEYLQNKTYFKNMDNKKTT